MSKEATKLFEKFAIREGVVLERGRYGELLRADARWAWFCWYSGWKRRQKVEKKKRARNASTEHK